MIVVPAYLAWKIGGGLKTTIFFALFTSIPILLITWTVFSSLSPRKNEKARYPNRGVEHYLEFHDEEDKLKYRGNKKIPMETFHEMYFDSKVSFKGDCLEMLEYRHDWASFRFTASLFRFFLLGFIPEVIMHTRSQGKSILNPHVKYSNVA
jgi:sphingolipid C9-methyltransferase